jgi:DNA polymerase III subunit delta
MSAHTYDTLYRALKKGQVERVYYLYGSEDVLKDDAARAILDQVLEPALRDFNFDQRSAGQLDAEAIELLCHTLPMMADRRVVLLRDVEAWKKKSKGRAAFLAYLERPSPDTVVILIQGSGEAEPDAELARHATAVNFEPLPPDRALRWLRHEAERSGLVLEERAAEHLLDCVGSDLGALRSELFKLAALPEGTPITVALVGDIVGVHQGQTMYDWRSAVLGDEPARAARLLGPVLAQSGMSGVKLVTLLGTSLVGLGMARAHYDRDKRLRGRALEEAVFASLRRVRPFGLGDWKGEAQRWSEWAPRWPAARVRAALRAALAADQALKSTTISKEDGVLMDLLMKVTVPYVEAA